MSVPSKLRDLGLQFQGIQVWVCAMSQLNGWDAAWCFWLLVEGIEPLGKGKGPMKCQVGVVGCMGIRVSFHFMVASRE